MTAGEPYASDDQTVVRLRAEQAPDLPSTQDAEPDPPAAEVPRGRRTRGSAAGSSFGDYARANPRAIGAVGLLAAGVVFVLLGWYGAANTNILTEQIPYLISGGLLGVALIIVAGFLASSASLERQNRELRADLRDALGGLAGARPAGRVAAADDAGDGRVYVVNGGRSYHFAGCPIIEGKEPSELAYADARATGYAACKLCGRD